MRNLSERIRSDVDIGTNVLIPIPNVDRGKGDPRNVLAVVINKDELGYKLALTRKHFFSPMLYFSHLNKGYKLHFQVCMLLNKDHVQNLHKLNK
jgi:hypothetical protein